MHFNLYLKISHHLQNKTIKTPIPLVSINVNLRKRPLLTLLYEILTMFPGYEGEISDSDEEGAMMSFGDSMVQRPLLPNFWLIMQIDKDRVNVIFHTR